jgi:hypothetical protein
MLRPVRRMIRRAMLSAGYRITRIPPPTQFPPAVLVAQGVDPYGTHFVPLAAAVARTSGAVLELGMGDHSTPLLHLLCRDRLLISADSSARWVERYAAFRSASHQLHAVDDWDRWHVIEEQAWAVAFVDCSPAELRVELVERLQGRAHFIVVHDTDPDLESSDAFAFGAALDRFKFRSDYRVFRPATTVVSDVESFLLTDAERLPG